MIDHALDRAVQAISAADAVLIGAGAGMGVDSGLPDFRGKEGFWRAYPPIAKLGLEFASVSNPSWFVKDPAFAFAFWKHRYHLYTTTKEHEGYHILKDLAAAKK